MRGSVARLARIAMGTAAAFALLPAAHAGAATIPVNSLLDENAAAADNGTCTLREAISATNANVDIDACDHDGGTGPDLIQFSGGGAVNLSIASTNEDANVNGDLDVLAGAGGVTISGGSGTTIDANSLDRVVHLVSGAGQLKLEDVTLREGSASNGGGLFVFLGGNAELEESTVTQNAVTLSGGGIGAAGGAGSTAITLDNTDVTLNTATGAGASAPGIAGASSALSVTNGSLISQNVASGNNSATGGGINATGTVNVSDSEISDNTVDGSGGGISFNIGTLNVTDSRIEDNEAKRLSPTGDQGGGGIDASSGTIAIDNSVIAENSTGTTESAPGGGLNFNGNLEPVITGSLIEGNSATRTGGGVQLSSQAGMDMRRTVVRSNEVIDPTNDGGGGGGIRDSGTGTTLIEDSLIEGNTSTVTANNNQGAGLFLSNGITNVVRSTIAGNALSGGTTQEGGGVHTFSSSNVDFVNVTIADNEAPGAGADGGGLFVGNSGDVNLSNATFVGNVASDLGDGIFNNAFSTSTLRSTIVADGCDAHPSSTGVTSVGTGNLQAPAATGCGLTSASPNFSGPVRSNGGVIGPTTIPVPQLTQAIGFGAAADRVAGDCLDHTGAPVANDARRVGRPFDAIPPAPAGCDSGAFELVTCMSERVEGPDAITGTPGPETITGTSGDDMIWADGGADTVQAGGGSDAVCGGPGPDDLQAEADRDFLSGGAGDDELDGGPNSVLGDTVNYLDSPAGVTVNLADGGATGEGTDTITGTEDIQGSRLNDVLTGNSAGNVIIAGSASSADNDVLAGGAGTGPDGNDNLIGGPDPGSVDRVTYASRTDAVTIGLAGGTGGDVSGPETDTLGNIDDAVGGSGADQIFGTTGPNSLTGGPGQDLVNADSGADSILIRDGEADTVSCGADNGNPDVDTVTTDQSGVDAISQCQVPPDVIDFFVPPVVNPPNNNPPVTEPPVGTPPTPPASTKRCKKGQKRKVVKGKTRCVKKKKKRKR